MPLPRKKHFSVGVVIGVILFIGILVLALCDFAPQQKTEEFVIQHTLD